VVSRRSRGLSIGVNLNPDKACNFDCLYCQVDSTVPPRVRKVDPAVVAGELDRMAAIAADGSLFRDPHFAHTPPALRRINDIAFSGDGEPTTCPRFTECVQIAADVKRRHGLDAVRIVLITDACYLTRPEVSAALEIMDAHQGEIWAKLDAGTEEYFRRINRPNFPLEHVIENITAAARVRAVCIQSLWLRLDGQPPPGEEVDAYCDRLNRIVSAGGVIKDVQTYTLARPPAEDRVTALSGNELERIARRVRDRTGLSVTTFAAPA